MAYFETAQTVSLPDTLPEYLALPERDDLTCAGCGRQQVTVYRDVVTCACGERWRWPPMVGGD